MTRSVMAALMLAAALASAAARAQEGTDAVGAASSGVAPAETASPAVKDQSASASDVIVTDRRADGYRAIDSDALGPNLDLRQIPATVNVTTADFIRRRTDLESQARRPSPRRRPSRKPTTGSPTG